MHLQRSPGRYCKKSSWFTSHHRNLGTTSGVDAAQRLVEARRELTNVIRNELRSLKDSEPTRKIYAITGHGIPSGLLAQLLDEARGWLLNQHQLTGQNMQSLNSTAASSVKMLFTNTPNSAMLDESRIRTVNVHGVTTKLASLPSEYERDFEMFMVVMDRVASRAASLAADNTETLVDDALVGTGSFVSPSKLNQWNVTFMKGEALPLSLMPKNPGVGSGLDSGKQGRHKDAPILTLEWVMNTKSDCWNVILRLQDDGSSATRGGTRDPLSLIFNGEYQIK